ncbi:MAG: hypothetical protein V7707_07065 [Motiliproteus sp.]
MEVRTIRKVILAAIALLVASEVIAWLYLVTSNITAILSGLVVFAIYAYCGKKATASTAKTVWFMVPVMLFTVVPVVIKFWPDGAAEQGSWLLSTITNIPFIVSFILPVILLFAAYFFLAEHSEDY